MYGITETTVHVTYREIVAADASRRHGSPVGVIRSRSVSPSSSSVTA